MSRRLLSTVGDALRRGLWRWRLRLGAAGLTALVLAVAAGSGAALLAWRARADQAQEAQLRQALAQASEALARQRQAQARQAAQQQELLKQAALAQAQADRPPVPRPGMQLDARAGDEFVDPEQPAQGAGLAASPPPPPPVLPPGTAPARVLLARLPPAAQRDDDLALVLALARDAGLANARAQYRRLEPRSAGIQRLEITLTANEDFEAWRRLMVGVLNRLPHAAVSGAAWSRPQADGGATEARMGFVLYHRTGGLP